MARPRESTSGGQSLVVASELVRVDAVAAAAEVNEVDVLVPAFVVVAGSARAAGPVAVVLLPAVLGEERFVMAIHAETDEHWRQGLPEGSRTTPDASFL